LYLLNRIMRPAPLCAVVVSAILAGCSQSTGALDNITTSSISSTRMSASAFSGSSRERDCLARAMFFESHRSSRDGLIAVGTVVMNRVRSDKYPDTICGVVGQKNQFAPGVLSRKMNSKALPDVMAAADAVLKGERHPAVRSAHHFHQAGLKFPYKNMHYVLTAGGNSFYEKRSRRQIAEMRDDNQKPASQASLVAYEAEKPGPNVIAELLAAQKVAENAE
jgi:spore germination cell wall hydrolase CwlJ-like protein